MKTPTLATTLMLLASALDRFHAERSGCGGDRPVLERLIRCCLRPAISLKRLT